MTAPDELERAVERLTSRLDDDEHHWSIDPREDWMLDASVFDLRLLLSERAELLAAVERMRGALGKITTNYGPGHLAHQIARAALTTGEEK